MQALSHTYFHDEQRLEGYVVYPERIKQPTPAVLVVHDWSGRNEFACQKAEMLAQLGYVGFAVDMYGDGQIGETLEQKKALMEPVISNRQFLRARIQAAFHSAMSLDNVDKTRIAVIGFCFGGLCALDLARSGAALKGVVSFHGLLDKPAGLDNQAIQAKILVLHGYADPMVTPEAVMTFCQEMTQANADWQVDMYGHTQHAFTNPQAHDEALGTVYNELAEHRAFAAMRAFLIECFS